MAFVARSWISSIVSSFRVRFRVAGVVVDEHEIQFAAEDLYAPV
jgi:hypothetical protein